MNWYLLCFLLYAVFITPVTVLVRVSVGQDVRFRVCLRAAGVSLLGKKGEKERMLPLHSSGWTQKLNDSRKEMLMNLYRQGAFGRIIRLLEWRQVEWVAHISLDDAAQTAVVYAALRVMWQTLRQICKTNMKARIEADFQGEGFGFEFRCIVSARVGNITAEGIRLWSATAREKNKHLKGEVAEYAAASH